MAESESKEKKLHWTKRPENKAKLAKMVKKSVAAKKAIRNGKQPKATKPKAAPKPQPTNNGSGIPEDTIAYALGHVECWIETFAKSAGVPSEALAFELGTVLRGKNGR